MGKKTDEENRGIDKTTGKGKAPGTKDSNTPGAAAGTNSGAGTRTGAGTETKEKKSLVGNMVIEPKPPELVSMQFPESTGEQDKPKRSHKKKVVVKKDLTALENNIMMVGFAGFGVAGMVTKQPEIWEISPDEMQRIAEPAARLIDQYGGTDTTNKYTDWIMLGGALTLVILPRIIAQIQLAKLHQKKEVDKIERTPDRNIGEHHSSSPGDNSSPITNLYEVISAGIV